MMKMNSRLYQYIIIILALGATSFVIASDDSVANKKEQSEMPAAPAGPYRSLLEKNNVSPPPKIMKAPVQVVPSPQLTKRPQQRMLANQNRNIPPQAQWNQRPPQMRTPVVPPAWANQVPPQQRMLPNQNRNIPPQAQWNQRPPQMRAPVVPPAWENQVPPQQRMAPNQKRNTPPHSQWNHRPPQMQWNRRPPQQRAVPNWKRNVSPQPQWQQPKLPAWVTNPPQQSIYPYGYRGR